ncbi:endonuclease/exonuclease/phosphatase family protein [Bacteroides sp. 224]|uniref:endonuclease/exonuclease/phosphatase family protein n=1 Tax=Bacteroides sp. 224 TaxID=2302936 RepID=UPI0013D72187|nr:endonuclease/exonuclease/phosphatase family protein [Bacteroides sp. 224]NDV66929.1 endonuclease [Bacteroides sp. 224]
MKKLLILFLFLPQLLIAQDTIPFRIAFFNVENLFDVCDDPLKDDNEFLPTSHRRWHYGRYKKKLADVARVITAVGEWEPPALVGLCEIENDTVMRDLTFYSPLKEHTYRYVMTNSPDPRGIDVALLYQRDKFKLLSKQSIPVKFKETKKVSRDILHVSGLIITKDTIDVFVVHFPSRSGGEKETENYRVQASLCLKNSVDSLMSVRVSPRIIIMGDFNDYPSNRSISEVLIGKTANQSYDRKQLYHLLASKSKKKNWGSYRYKGNWGLLDHIIVSGGLLDNQSCFYTDEDKANVSFLPFMLIEDEKYGGLSPFRTYSGMRYQGGFSDHLPVYADFLLIHK